jgi:hypothetical protein
MSIAFVQFVLLCCFAGFRRTLYHFMTFNALLGLWDWLAGIRQAWFWILVRVIGTEILVLTQFGVSRRVYRCFCPLKKDPDEKNTMMTTKY